MKKIYNFIRKYISHEMFMYLLFGVLTTIVNFLVFYLCNIIIKMGTGISTTIAFIAGVIFAYITNKIWVFNSKTNGILELLKEMGKFLVARLFTYFVDLVLMIILVDKYDFNSMICKLLVNVVVVILNYIFSKLLIFKKGR